MNLFDLHPKPETLKGYQQRFQVPELAYEEAVKRAKGKKGQERRSPDLEQVLVKDPVWAFMYARDVIKGRWPEAEPVIATSPEDTYYYGLYLISKNIKLSPEIEKVYHSEERRVWDE